MAVNVPSSSRQLLSAFALAMVMFAQLRSSSASPSAALHPRRQNDDGLPGHSGRSRRSDAAAGSSTGSMCKSLGKLYSEVFAQKPVACSLLDSFSNVEAPARSLAEHLFLGLSRLSISKKPSPLLKVHVTGGGENPMVDYKKQSLYLAGILRHMTTEEIPVLLANHRARLEEHSGSAANTLAKRTHLPVIKRLLQKGRHLAQHSMRKLSIMTGTSPAETERAAVTLARDTVQQVMARRQDKPNLVQSHSILVTYCSTLSAMAESLQGVIAGAC
ncbi:uncharacterized protein LOC135813584 [Sycon ciliatum]|uniref:uncharacterized protein LOC135813584 n=1 Tax=Sycon ciliatum TaxID=27933 RepID=UPI0031F71A96